MPSSDDEEDDYMTMVLPTTAPAGPKTSLARAAAKRKAAEAAAKPPSKRAQTEAAAKQTEAGLSRSLLAAETDRDALALGGGAPSRGAALLAKLGYTGGGLGAKGEGVVEPLRPVRREGKAGIGTSRVVETTKVTPKAPFDVGDFRERRAREEKERREEGRLRAAVRVGEGLWGEREEKAPVALRWGRREAEAREAEKRREQERRRRMERLELDADVSGIKDHDGLEEDLDDLVAKGESLAALPDVGEDEKEDHELDDFMTLPMQERLEKAVLWLREDFRYCFWCGAQYEDKAMTGCPGPEEDMH